MKEFLNCINIGEKSDLGDGRIIFKCKLEELKMKWLQDGHTNHNFYGHVCVYTNNKPTVLSEHWECLSFSPTFYSLMKKVLDKETKI